jgi:hypothetical protein
MSTRDPPSYTDVLEFRDQIQAKGHRVTSVFANGQVSEKQLNKMLNGQDFRTNDTESGASSPLDNLSTPDLTMAHPRAPSSRTSNEEEPFPRIIGIGPTQYSRETENDSETEHGSPESGS